MIDIPSVLFKIGDSTPKLAWGETDDGYPMFRCVCGQWFCLTPTWKIDDQGRVTPSVHHNSPECGFHDYIGLKGWRNRKAST